MKIYPRSEWGARYGNGSAGATKRSEVIAHTTVTPLMSVESSFAAEASVMRGMERFHAVDRGFNGIGYSFCIADSGRVFEGRGWGRNGAHTQSGGNTKGYGIAFIGDGTKRAPSAKAWASFRWLIGIGIEQGYITKGYRLTGHRDWWNKACPGDFIWNMMQAEAGNVTGAVEQPSDWLLGLGSDSVAVGVWQQQLNDVHGAGLQRDNDFGPRTEAATRSFELVNELPVNGYVSQADIDKMTAYYTSPPRPEPPVDDEDVEPSPPQQLRDYAVAVRYSRNPADERIGRALAAAMHLHAAAYTDKSSAQNVFLVGGQAVAEADRSKYDAVVELAGATRNETLNAVVEVIRVYLLQLS